MDTPHLPGATTRRPSLGRRAAGLGLLCVAVLSGCGGGSADEVDRDTDPPASRSEIAAARRARAQAAVDVALRANPDDMAARVAPAALAAWQPRVGDTWQWQLSGTIDTGYAVAVYDIDLFDAPDAVIARLQARGRRVVCYFSAGSSENWRPDFARFRAADLGNPLDGWAGERWVDTRSANVRRIMRARLDRAKARGCDGVEPDNVDGYVNDPGLPLTAATQLDYNRFLAAEAHARGLKIGLKNDLDQLTALQPVFDFAVNEQCHQYGECAGYAVFTGHGKPVFNAEYRQRWRTDAAARAKLCAQAKASKLRTLVLPLALNDAFRYSCD